MNFKNSLEFAKQCDTEDTLKNFREQFHLPLHNGKPALYFTGNSLGLQPKKTAEYVNQELKDWAELGVEGHFKKDTGWFGYHELLRDSTARLVGALPHEVVVMNQLTVNLHLLMVTFYRPTKQRYKIICEANAFPSDRYALQSQVQVHGYKAADAIIELKPREGEYLLREEDILKAVADCGEELAVLMMGGLNYYSGQIFNMQTIAKAVHDVGAMCGFDLAHAAGNIKLNLHDWNIDFACWCSYKYLNAGPGGVAGVYIHEQHAKNKSLPRFAGWWGNNPDNRFQMLHDFDPVESADAWQLSNAPILPMAALRASMEIYDKAGMDALTKKSLLLTGYLQFIIKDVLEKKNKPTFINIITPFDTQQQGCQLSLIVKENGKKVFDKLTTAGVIADWREPDVLRMAPVPLYNSFQDVYLFGEELGKAID